MVKWKEYEKVKERTWEECGRIRLDVPHVVEEFEKTLRKPMKGKKIAGKSTSGMGPIVKATNKRTTVAKSASGEARVGKSGKRKRRCEGEILSLNNAVKMKCRFILE